MMRRKSKHKEYSLFNYMMLTTVTAIVVIIATMIIAILTTIKIAVPSVVRDRLGRENGKALESIVFSGDACEVKGYSAGIDGYNYVIVRDNGEIIYGDPILDRDDIKRIISQHRMYSEYDIGVDKLYIRVDIVRKREPKQDSQQATNPDKPRDEDIYLAASLKASSVTGVYDGIKYTAVIITILVGCALILLELYLNKKVAEPIEVMYKLTEDFEDSLKFDKRVEENGFFREINSFAHAYNNLIDTIEHNYEVQKKYNSNVSHELRTPIAVMSAQCQVAKKKYADKEGEQYAEMREMIDVMERQISVMNTIVRQLLEISRLENDAFDLYSEVVDMKDIVECICEDVDILSDGAQPFECNLESVEFMGNNSLIMGVIRNLIVNAVKYNRDNNPIFIRVWRERDRAVCSVIDHGIGIPRDKMDELFEPFFRVEESRSSEGFGLGLTLTKRIIETYHGEIEVESRYGHGSEFRFYIPIIKPND